jgi:hypothetical protein
MFNTKRDIPLGRLHDRQVGRLFALENPAGVDTGCTKMLSVVPQSMHMRATSPGSPPNGAISATLDIGRPHRLHALCAATFIILPLELGPSLLPMRVNE